MSGVQVIVAGQTHYRGKGFTLDPSSWEEYFAFINDFLEPARPVVSGSAAGVENAASTSNTAQLAAPDRIFRPVGMDRSQVERAWEYAYQFFFDYPLPFPWHMLYCWDELEEWSLERVLSDEGKVKFASSFQPLLGNSRRWGESGSMNNQHLMDQASQAADPDTSTALNPQWMVERQKYSTSPIEGDAHVKKAVREFYDQVGWQLVGEDLYQNAHYEDLRSVSREYITRCHHRVKTHLNPGGEYLLCTDRQRE